MPDGFFNVPVSVSAGVVAAAGVAVCLRATRRELDDRAAPMAGLVAAFVFAVQLLNFPVAAGTSGHLLGGALAAVLVGPYTAVLCMAVVLLVQGLAFADGGLSALGVNITLMGIVTVVVGWGVFLLVRRLFGGGRGAIVAGASAGALISVPVSALVFTLLFWIGGNAPIEPGTVAAAMGGVHVLIGIGEALITAVTVSTVLAVRPDLVYGARGLTGRLVLRGADGETTEAGQETRPMARPRASRPGGFLLAGIVVAALLAGVVSFFASASPDGLERVAEDAGFISSATDHPLRGQPLADYGEAGGIPVGIAGLIGVGVTALVGGGLSYAVGRRRARAYAED
ncbi:energy-coupling factor ABC transporter permease [Spongiactinospora sp. 9N601]|uniref:energy-coupling factor ABC transporter permease n=1 Tax=Spongiactinospora sp. 9N601 TaxID=3375149 RepID=UPI0037971B3E